MSDQDKPYFIVQTLERALVVLNEFIAERRPLSISELTSRLNVHKSIVHRLVATLAHYGYLEKERGSDDYRLGPKSFQLGTTYMGASNLVEQSTKWLNEIVFETGNTAHLAVLQGGEVVYLLNLEPAVTQRMYAFFGWRSQVHYTGLGKALTAWLDEDRVLGILEQTGMAARTSKTITSAELFIKELKRVRRVGYAVDNEEGDMGHRCLSVPLRDHTGRVVAAISITGTLQTNPENREKELAMRLKKCGERISFQLGYSP